jgi:adhesin transport system outer membrane protein
MARDGAPAAPSHRVSEMGFLHFRSRWLATVALALALGAVAGVPAPARAVSASLASSGRQPIPLDAPLPKLEPAAAALKNRCVGDEPADPKAAPTFFSAPASPASGPLPVDVRAPRMDLLNLVQLAIRRSNAVGASRLLADSAADDVQEARAGHMPQASVSGQLGGIDAGAPNTTSTRGSLFQGGLSVTAPLYDGGRINDLTDWRRHLAEAARQGEIGAQEQVALQTVSLALERSRYSVESQVYEQYAHKMGCLVDALQMIVSVDRGRTSELVQARKTQQQAELSRDQSLSQKRLAEVRLRRFVGNDLPPVEGITSVMLDTPALDDLLTMAARTSDVQQLDSQADAMDSYVRAILDGQKPQLGVLVAATKSGGAGNSRSMSGGVTVSWQLFNAANTYTTSSARKRAAAARLQRDDVLEARKNRMAEVHEQAEHAMQRARQIVEILHNSELVRNFTLQQWQQLGRRSLFDVMGAEGDHYNMRVQYVDALYDTQQSNALLWSLGLGLAVHLQ